jgi:ATP-dependent Clp protease ATP-binding subunit ClpA
MQTAFNELIITKKIYAAPLKNHAQIPLISDTLCRLNQHHLLLEGPTSKLLRRAFSESIAAANPHMDFIYWDQDLHSHHEELAASIDALEKTTVYMIDGSISSVIASIFKNFQHHAYARFIFFDVEIPQDCKKSLSHIHWEINAENDILALLKVFADQLENFYGTTISEEIFTYAYSLTNHYLGTHASFDTAMELIDNALARAKRDNSVLSTDTIAAVVASKTQIPVTHLHHNKLKATQLVPALQQQVFGQDAAIHLISNALQSIPLQSADRNSPLSCFLLVGKQGVGKRKLASELAHYLFGSNNALLEIIPEATITPWLNLKVKTHGDNLSLQEAIQKKPYAIVLFENIDEAFTTSTAFLDEIMSHPDFYHAILIVTTTKGCEKLTAKETSASQNAAPIMDLMQLVLNENPLFSSTRETSHTHLHEPIFQELKPYFSATFLRQIQLIPCLPLESAALEKMMRLKLQQLTKTVASRFQIDLQHAPEVITFLTHAMQKNTSSFNTLERTLEHYLYPCISHAVFSRIDGLERQRRLFISLNDSGHLLKSEFVSVSHKEYQA